MTLTVIPLNSPVLERQTEVQYGLVTNKGEPRVTGLPRRVAGFPGTEVYTLAEDNLNLVGRMQTTFRTGMSFQENI